MDPFFQYHKPIINIQFKNERYQNPGILKNFDYNTIITGSSMVENFRISWFENEDPTVKVVKVPYSAGFSKDYNNVFKLAFDTHNLKTVYYGMDLFWLFNSKGDETKIEIPEYLYDNNILNDVQYLFNKDTFINYTIDNIKKNLTGKNTDYDLAYNWNQTYEFKKEIALKTYTRPPVQMKQNTEALMLNYEENMDNITEYIKKYPDTTFKIFFPPYSILEWDMANRQGLTDAQMAVTRKVIEDLLVYENVEMYYFQNIESIITNLDNYKDYSHYKEDINYYMFEDMCKNREHRITRENYLEELGKMYDIAINYNYEKIFEK